MVNSTSGRVACRAPLRISLAGGGTDLPSFARQNGAGLVISIAIDRYVEVTAPTAGVRASQGSTRERRALPLLVEPAHVYVDAAARVVQAPVPQSLGCSSDVQPGKGLGGSGAFTVALVGLISASNNRSLEPASIAQSASDIEIEALARPVGRQDHFIAALGGVLALHVDRAGNITPERMNLPSSVKKELEASLMLFDTGGTHDAAEVLSVQSSRANVGDPDSISHLQAIKEIADSMIVDLENGNLTNLGPCLTEHWRLKRRLNGAITTSRVDQLISTALEAGANGAKLLGAGGSGYVLVSVNQANRDHVRYAMESVNAPELCFGLSPKGLETFCE